MAITRTSTVLRFGATADQYKVEMDAVNGQGSNAYNEYITAVTFCTVGNAGVCKLTEKSDGSGGSIAEVTLKTNESMLVGPGLEASFKGGLLFTAPVSAYALVYLTQDLD